MKNKLVMTLSVEGIEKQRLEAELSQSLDIINIINRKIIGLPKISGENHINPGAVKDVETAYKVFESIHHTEYSNKQVNIGLNYM